MENRGQDFLDSFVLTGKAGLGASANLKLGPVTFGAGYWEGYEAGLHGSEGFTVTRIKVFSCPAILNFPLPTPTLLILVLTDRLPYKELSLAGLIFTKFTEIDFILEKDRWKRFRKSIYNVYTVEYEATRPIPLDGTAPRFLWKRFFAVELDLSFFLGVRIGFNAIEFLDFVLGWFGLDILEDDDAKEVK
jgi:hypothetical protein